MKTINIATDKKCDDCTVFCVTSHGDILFEADTNEQDYIVTRLLAESWYPGTEEEWLDSVEYRFQQLTQGDKTMRTKINLDPETVICPHCKKINKYARDDGAVEGPREYHADCWDLAEATMSQGQIDEAWESSI